MVKATDLAKYVIHYANERKKLITNLKLQKVLYYVAGVYLAIYDEPLFADHIEAWQYGPVIRTVYIEYCTHGALPLQENTKIDLPLSPNELQLINFVLDQKLALTGCELVTATHQESPWRTHKQETANKPIITSEELIAHFKVSSEVMTWKKHIA